MSDRTTPYEEFGNIENRIDEIVRGNWFHLEMMDEDVAWMRVGSDIFWISAVKGKLVVRYSETELESQ